MDKECRLPHQETKDIGAIKLTVTAATLPAPTLTVHPEGIQDGENRILALDSSACTLPGVGGAALGHGASLAGGLR